MVVATRMRRQSVFIWTTLLLCTALTVGVRLHEINEPGWEFAPARQYHSALIARGLYLENQESVSEWKQRIASRNADDAGVVGEPPVIELITSIAWRAAGGEHLWLPRLISVLAWLIGGAFLFLIARRIASEEAAACSVWFYLFLHFAIDASRSFQPDPLVVTLLLACVLLICRYREAPTQRRFWAAGASSGIAILAKPGVVLFPILGAFLALSINERGVRATLTSWRTYVFGTVCVAPTAIYAFVGTYVAGFLAGDTEGRFLPHLVGSTDYWEGWLRMVEKVAGVGPLILALLGLLLARGLGRALLLGLFAGYFAYGLTFSFHIHTHDYYSLQVIPIIALALTPVTDAVIDRVRAAAGRPLLRTGLAAMLLLASGALAAREIHARVTAPPDQFHHPVELYEEIGATVRHSGRTLFLDQDFGESLKYYGFISGAYWPMRDEIRDELQWRDDPPSSAMERLRRDYWPHHRNTAGPPEYFIVTKLDELDLQPDLRRLLERFPVRERTDAYVIYDLRGRYPL